MNQHLRLEQRMLRRATSCRQSGLETFIYFGFFAVHSFLFFFLKLFMIPVSSFPLFHIFRLFAVQNSLSIAIAAFSMVFKTLRSIPSEILCGIHDVFRITGPANLNNELNSYL